MLILSILALVILTVGSWVLVEYAASASGTIQEPIITWNLYVAPTISALSTALILLFVNRRISQSDKKDERIQALLAEREAVKEASVKEWRERYSTTQCDIKESVEEIKVCIADIEKGKVEWSHCNERRKEVDERLRNGGH